MLVETVWLWYETVSYGNSAAYHGDCLGTLRREMIISWCPTPTSPLASSPFFTSQNHPRTWYGGETHGDVLGTFHQHLRDYIY